MRETDSLSIAAQNNTIRDNNVKTKTDYSQKNGDCRFCGDRCETVNHIISKISNWPKRNRRFGLNGWEK